MIKLEVNAARLDEDLENAWEVLAEPIQSVMRRYGLPEPYEQLKELTRGQGMTQERIQVFVKGLGLPSQVSDALLGLAPGTYVGNASLLAKSELTQS
jgi:adenylosuccinate lyase